MNKKNIPLYLGLAIPILMIVLVAAFIYLPGIGQKPKQNFLYMTGSNVYYYPTPGGPYGYHVKQGHLIYSEAPSTTPPSYSYGDSKSDPLFYVYDFNTNQASQVTFEQAQAYTLDVSGTSSDGYVLQRGNYSGGGLFFGGGTNDYNSWFVKGHNRSRKLNLKLSGTNIYSDNFQFLGWIQ